MRDNKPKWLQKEEPTRKKSGKQEKRLAKEFKGRVTTNSGSTFSENDVVSPHFEIEAKTTESKQYILKIEDIKKMERKADKNKIPLFIVEFSQFNRELVIIDKQDFLTLNGIKKMIDKP